jgi:hypothetical protein
VLFYKIEQPKQEAGMPVTADKSAPYAPPSAVLDIVARYRNRGLPFPVNSDVLARAGISDSLIPRTLLALQTLDLIQDNGNPTETLEGLRLAAAAEFKNRLGDWLKSAYAEVFAFVDPSTDDETRIRDAFRSYQPVGQQNRMVTLFQGLCTAAGLIGDKPAAAPRPSPHRTRKVIAPATARSPQKPIAKSQTKDPIALPPALSGLLESLPLPSDGWTQAERAKFLVTFQAVLDFCIPVVEASATTENGGQP